MSGVINPKNPFRIIDGTHPLADIWIASEGRTDVDYHYGGTRLVSSSTSQQEAVSILKDLAFFESGIKNRLINRAFANGALTGLESKIPEGLARSMVGGGRCIIRPRSNEASAILTDVRHSEFPAAVDSVLREVGLLLNQHGGHIKLTPDFGRNAFLADILKRHTSHSLGIRCEDGGCGGKSSYTTTGIIEAVEILCGKTLKGPVTLIGSAGALGSDFLRYLVDQGVSDLAVCDLSYADPDEAREVEGIRVLKAEQGRFTKECLLRGGIIIATTVGHELINSDHGAIPPGTNLFLAHNSALPTNAEGIELARSLSSRDILAVPGPVLTLGGALTSRVEWFSRQTRPGTAFDKELAHEIVRRVTGFCLQEIAGHESATGVTPYEAMFALAVD